MTAEKSPDSLKALPLLLSRNTDQADCNFDDNCLSIVNATESFIELNRLGRNAFRCQTSNVCNVDARSIKSPKIGHPFLDGLLFAYEYGVSFTLSPELIWDLAVSGIVTYLHQYEFTADALAQYRHDCTGCPDGRFRLCMADFGHRELLQGNFHPKIWPAVSKEIDSAVKNMCSVASQIAIPLDRSNRNSKRALLDLRASVTGMQSVNIIAHRTVVPRHNAKTDQEAVDTPKGIHSFLFKGQLSDWVDLMRGLSQLATFPTFAAWGMRLMFIVDHIVEHYNRFTPPQKRAQLDPAVHKYLYDEKIEKMEPADLFRKFINVRKDSETGSIERISGFALFLFPVECGYFQTAPPCHPDLSLFAAPFIDFEPLVYGLPIDSFVNHLITFESILITPTTDVPLTCYCGPIGWSVHAKQRAVEVAGGRFVVFHNALAKICLPTVCDSDTSRPTWQEEKHLVDKNVQQFAAHDAGDQVMRVGFVDDLIFALEACSGDSRKLSDYLAQNLDKDMTQKVVCWPQADAMLEKCVQISNWCLDSVAPVASEPREPAVVEKQELVVVEPLVVEKQETLVVEPVVVEKQEPVVIEPVVVEPVVVEPVVIEPLIVEPLVVEKQEPCKECSTVKKNSSKLHAKFRAKELRQEKEIAKLKSRLDKLTRKLDSQAQFIQDQKKLIHASASSASQKKSRACDNNIVSTESIHAMVFTILTKQNRSKQQAIENFAQTCSRPSAWRRMTANHCCSMHRNTEMAPPRDKNFLDRILQKKEHWTLHSILTALIDQRLNCFLCSEQFDLKMDLDLLFLTTQQQKQRFPLPLVEFAHTIYTLTEKMPFRAKEFQSCFTCNATLVDNIYSTSFVLNGVDDQGMVHGRIGFYCKEKKSCTARLQKKLSDKDGNGLCESTGFAFSVIAHRNLDGDNVVRIYCEDDDVTEDGFPDPSEHDLLLYLPSIVVPTFSK